MPPHGGVPTQAKLSFHFGTRVTWDGQLKHDIANLLLRTPTGGEAPLSTAAAFTRGTSYTTIKRADGRRVVTVTGDVVAGQANASEILTASEAL